ncbi:BON domain-containing protein [Castellaniella ginsengisoli]|uniref:BON domain-containing protein n=1 Tax=Castellaniella ginsengisoli TaxID=546114 RepID=A0AB39D926_9BURK
MIRSRYLSAWTLAVAVLALTACAAPNHSPYENVSGDEPGDVAVTGPSRYQGTQSGAMMINHQNAVINANVISAVSAVPGLRNSNLQVGTLHGVVSLRGTVDSRAAAESAVQAARQVPGVRSVNYDLQIL